jgi:hypothetical protein
MADEEQPVLEKEHEQSTLLSRRAFVTGALAGGAASVVVAAGTGLAVYRTMDTHAEEALAEAESEVARLQGLVALYEKIEKVGLDGILQTGMVAVAAPLEIVQRGAELLKGGLEGIETAVLALREALPSATEAFAWLKGTVETLADAIDRLHGATEKVVERATDNRVATTLGNALQSVLSHLPFSWGDKIREAFDWLVTLIAHADDLVRDLNVRLLEPVEQRWFSSDQGKGLGAAFLDPLVERLLDPLEAHLGELAGLVDAWQAKLAAPAQQALEERSRLREEIALYREREGLPR